MSNLDQTRNFVKKAAALKGWVVNPDETFTRNIIQGLERNRATLGCYLCPCRDSSGQKEKDRDILCPCAYAQADLDEYGHCFCALFMTPEFAASGKEPSSIPERRDL